MQPTATAQLVQARKITLDGDTSAQATLADLMATFAPNFDIVTH